MTEPMKAYNVRDKNSFYSTVVFAESSNKAKAIAMHTDACEDVPYTDIRTKRMPMLDKYYRGKKEMDWYDDDDRIAMVKDGKFHCFDGIEECKNCPAKEYCDYNEVAE